MGNIREYQIIKKRSHLLELKLLRINFYRMETEPGIMIPPIHDPTAEWLLLDGETLRTEPEDDIPEHQHLIRTRWGVCQKITLIGGHSYCYRIEIRHDPNESEEMGLWVHGPLKEGVERQTPVWELQEPPFPDTPISHDMIFTCPHNGEYYVGLKREASSQSIIEVISFSVQSYDTVLQQEIDQITATNETLMTQLQAEQDNRRRWEERYTTLQHTNTQLLQQIRDMKEKCDRKFSPILEDQSQLIVFMRRQITFLQSRMLLRLKEERSTPQIANMVGSI